MLNSLKAVGHFVEQPAVVARVRDRLLALAALGGGALLARDVYQAPAGQRRTVAVRDALVLGTSIAGTALAARRLRMFEPQARTVAADVMADIARQFRGSAAWPRLQALLEKPTRTLAEFRELFTALGPETSRRAFPIELNTADWREALKFFAVGALSIGSGFAGGLAADAVTGAPEGSTMRKLREGVWQLFANTAMCAVGAGVALTGLAAAPVKTWLGRRSTPVRALVQLGTVGSGLAAGILSGGYVANAVNRHVLNPLFAAWESREPHHRETGLPEAVQAFRQKPDRRIEPSDLALHVDDVPSMLALAGAKFFGPLVPLCFMFSAYKTGIGYEQQAVPQAEKPVKPVRRGLQLAGGDTLAFAPLDRARHDVFQAARTYATRHWV